MLCLAEAMLPPGADPARPLEAAPRPPAAADLAAPGSTGRGTEGGLPPPGGEIPPPPS